MPSSTRTFAVAVSAAARRVMAAPGASFVTVGFYLIVVSVLSALWRVAAGANGGDVAGYSAVALTWYILTTEAGHMALNTRMIEELGDDVITGAIAVEMLRPASVLGLRVGSQLGRAAPRVALLVVIGGLVTTATVGGPPSWTSLAIAVPSVVLAVACNVLCQHAFAASAFWIRSAGSAWMLYHKLVFVLGALLIPLEVLPDWLQRAAAVLPFRAMAYIPGRLASGHVEPLLLLEQAGWLIALAIVAVALFRAGERRLQVVGG